MIKLTQGESFPIMIKINQDGTTLTPDMIEDLRICIGDYHRTYGSGEVKYDTTQLSWYVHPTQQETLAMKVGKYDICCHVKYLDGTVIIQDVGRLVVEKGCCGEVL